MKFYLYFILLLCFSCNKTIIPNFSSGFYHGSHVLLGFGTEFFVAFQGNSIEVDCYTRMKKELIFVERDTLVQTDVNRYKGKLYEITIEENKAKIYVQKDYPLVKFRMVSLELKERKRGLLNVLKKRGKKRDASNNILLQK